MRALVKLVVVVLVLVAAIVFLGPMAPEGTFIADLSKGMRETFNAWWGFPLGLPGA
jgi:hypothetical protein